MICPFGIENMVVDDPGSKMREVRALPESILAVTIVNRFTARVVAQAEPYTRWLAPAVKRLRPLPVPYTDSG